MATKTYPVQGMTCSSCEVLIERKLRKVPGVERVTVRRFAEKVEIKSAVEVPLETLQQALQGEKYTILSETSPVLQGSRRTWAEIGAVLVILAGLYILLTQFNLLPDTLGVTDTMTYGFVLVLGLVAAFSTCLAVSGGLLLGVSARYNEQHPHATKRQKLLPHLYFNVGRIVSYTILGGLVGLIGSAFALSSWTMGILTLVASVLMVVMGVQLLGIFPWLNRFQIKMPKFIAHKIYDQHEQGKSGSWRSFLFGAATFFLPCGFTQALQLYVLSKGDPTVGALTMLVFSLGTLPSLLSIGLLTTFTKGTVQRYVTTFSAVLIIVLGVYNLPSGLTLVGAATVDVPVVDAPPVLLDDVQVISMAVNGYDYAPNSFTLKKGVPVEWRIDGKNARGCAKIITAPKLGVTERLNSDSVTIIRFTPTAAGSVQFTCTMGMAGPGVFTVV